ncbi:MAG TPA: polyprenyl synthetase family protein [Spirochaetia bacterium]|nr:polyprenyl synthetase family protein [Spirochaetia bacterium]
MMELERFAAPVRAELEEADARIGALVDGICRDGMLPDLCEQFVQPAVRHLFRTSGKLLRPLLVLLSARASGVREVAGIGGSASQEALVRAAAGVELLHTASLAHDDMVDGSAERRGSPSLHVAYGSTTAILVGDVFYSRFFQELTCLPGTAPAARLRLLQVFLSVTGRMCTGEILEEQLRAEGGIPSLDVYLDITDAKTAGLVSACCLAGGLLAGADESACQSLAAYGKAVGLLFQITDDLMDGDGAYPDRMAMTIEASKNRIAALTSILDLPPGDATDALRRLPAFLYARAGLVSAS